MKSPDINVSVQINIAAQGNLSAKINQPEHTRARLYEGYQERKTMVERQQPVPVLRPSGMGAAQVDRQIHHQQLRQDHRQAITTNQRAQQIYNKSVADLPNFAKSAREKAVTQQFNNNISHMPQNRTQQVQTQHMKPQQW